MAVVETRERTNLTTLLQVASQPASHRGEHGEEHFSEFSHWLKVVTPSVQRGRVSLAMANWDHALIYTLLSVVKAARESNTCFLEFVQSMCCSCCVQNSLFSEQDSDTPLLKYLDLASCRFHRSSNLFPTF
ncbi:hypothetical protein MPTK2_7g01320 [Marchantia polymorpha subsp. ruderalis]